MIPLFTTLAGSRAYGLERPDSDTDYHSVYALHTMDLLSLGTVDHRQHAHEKKDGNTEHSIISWEVGHFLHLATKCNPTVLEVFHTPLVEDTEVFTQSLRALFPSVWNTRGVRDAYLGYALSQHGRMQRENPARARKAAIARLRILYQGTILLEERRFVVHLGNEEIFPLCCALRDGTEPLATAYTTSMLLEKRLKQAADTGSPKETDLSRVNHVLLQLRNYYW